MTIEVALVAQIIDDSGKARICQLADVNIELARATGCLRPNWSLAA